MPHPDETASGDASPEATPDGGLPKRRRAIFPWAWIGVLVGARVAIGLADVTIDFKTIATLAAIILGIVGLSAWYLVRGRRPLLTRFAVAAAPFVLFAVWYSLYEPLFNGAGAIVGFHRRNASKPDEQLERVETQNAGLADWGPGEYDYPRFLGVGPWAEAVGPPLASDWAENPPQELWRREVGAGWSSFAVYGASAVTQEQRGDEELVVCYRALTGEPVWSHADTVRFDPDDVAGQMGRQGPRATPTIVGDRVYTQGAMGLVNCLDARTGEVIWRRDTAEDYGATVPVWGKSGSPLLVPALDGDATDLIVINVGAPDADKPDDYNASLVAFDAATGDEVWRDGSEQTSYASPELVTLYGERVVLQTCDDLLTATRAEDGTRLFDSPWSGQSNNMPSCSQPIELPGDRLLLTKGYGHGSSLLKVERAEGAWSVEPLWSPAIKPVLQTKFSNTVVRDGHAYAFNGEQLQCVEIETGKIAWRKRRRPSFGFGQVLMAGELLIVMTEESGEVVLVRATPDRYQELSQLQALADGEVCWNNPVVAGDLLLVRNAVEAAAYRLPLANPAADEVAASGSGAEEPVSTD